MRKADDQICIWCSGRYHYDKKPKCRCDDTTSASCMRNFMFQHPPCSVAKKLKPEEDKFDRHVRRYQETYVAIDKLEKITADNFQEKMKQHERMFDLHAPSKRRRFNTKCCLCHGYGHIELHCSAHR